MKEVTENWLTHLPHSIMGRAVLVRAHSNQGKIMKLIQRMVSQKSLHLTKIWITWMSIGTFTSKIRLCWHKLTKLQTTEMTYCLKLSKSRASTIKTWIDCKAKGIALGERNITEGAQTTSNVGINVLIKSVKNSMAPRARLTFILR
jgi:hypothetical protein